MSQILYYHLSVFSCKDHSFKNYFLRFGGWARKTILNITLAKLFSAVSSSRSTPHANQRSWLVLCCGSAQVAVDYVDTTAKAFPGVYWMVC